MSRIKQLIKYNREVDYKITTRHHLIFWSIYFILNTMRWGSYFNDYLYSFQTNIIGFLIHMTLSYFNIYYLMPRFVLQRKYLSYIILLLSSVFIMVVAKFNLTYFLVSQDVWPEGPRIIHEITLDYTIDMMIGELYVIAFATAIKTTMDWIHEHKRLTDLEKVQNETELLFLRSQISPHFFFNTLNNIYSLAMTKSDKTPKIILKLSELMRYILYNTKPKRQNLEDEIFCIQNYLDIERMRHGERLEINMTLSGNISDKKIAPILLLSFIENAFKHGANKNIGHIKIDIDFKIEKDFLYFRIENPLPANSDFKQTVETPGGIGLENVKKRLQLGYSKEEYSLNISGKEDRFIVDLKIKVA